MKGRPAGLQAGCLHGQGWLGLERWDAAARFGMKLRGHCPGQVCCLSHVCTTGSMEQGTSVWEHAKGLISAPAHVTC